MFGRNVPGQSNNRETLIVLIISNGTNMLIKEEDKVVFYTDRSNVFST